MRLILLFFFALVLNNQLIAQASYSGNVVDAFDKKYLESVTVSNSQTGEYTFTNERGYFSLKASFGDTIKVSFPGFIDLKLLAGEERFLFLELQDKARLLPTFQVDAEPYSYRFKDGVLTLVDENEPEPESKEGEITTGVSNSPNGGFAMYGVISYFTKKSKQAREYRKKQLWHSRRAGYYSVVESDSVRRNLMVKHQLDRKTWDQIIIDYNTLNQSHEFLDWSTEQVYASLEAFIDRARPYSF